MRVIKMMALLAMDTISMMAENLPLKRLMINQATLN